MNVSSNVLHAIVLTIAIAAYVVLTVTGHDGNVVFAFIGGQGTGFVIQTVATNSNVPPTVEVAPSRSTIKP